MASFRLFPGSFALPLLLLLGAAAPGCANAQDSDFVLRPLLPETSTEARADDKFRFIFGTPAKWMSTIAWRYNGNGAPSALADHAAAVALITAAGAKWSAACGVKFQYQGETSVVPDSRSTVNGHEFPDGNNVFGWGTIGNATAGITYSWHGSGSPLPLQDSDVIFAPQFVTGSRDLDRVATHELGHVLGLSHSDFNATIMSGPPLTNYNLLTAPVADDVRGCRCLYGLPTGVAAGYSCSLPASLDFGSVGAGTTSNARSVSIVNQGNAPLVLRDAAVDGLDFEVGGPCATATLQPGENCTLSVTAKPRRTGVIAGTLFLSGSDGLYRMPLTVQGVTAAPPIALSDVVEFYNASLQHYFISIDPQEIGDLDRQDHVGWVRTGLGFKAYIATTSDTNPVCRYYIPPAKGDSHFFSASAVECATVLQKILTDPNYSGFTLEAEHAFYIGIPDANGSCPSGTDAVYRLWNQGRAGSNHRYTTSRAVRDQMLASGYTSEGEGADGVAMCAPQ